MKAIPGGYAGCDQDLPGDRRFEFEFMGGSMGVRPRRAFRARRPDCREGDMPFICVTASGGARMQEGLFSLMQMAKTTAALTKLSERACPLPFSPHRPDHGRCVRVLRLRRRRCPRRAQER